MRLSPEHARVIVDTIKKVIPEAKIYLHGSRVDDSKRGGDIDLLLLCPDSESKSKAQVLREKILVMLKDYLDDQRIDLTIITEDDLRTEAIFRQMLESGVLLG